MHSQVLVYILLIFSIDYAFITEAKYTPDWESLDTRPVPQWYKDAKIGIILHWGVYSVPSFGTEWFWANWKKEEDPEYEDFMKKNYKPDFTYQDFANEFTAELFNATQWANLFSDSGARYVVLTGKHYDGFTLWPSKESPNWNSLDVGPKRDLVGELSVAVRSQNNLKFGVYYSLVEWFNRMYIDDKSHDFKKRSFLEKKVWPELKDLVENYLPDILWTPGHWEEPTYYWNSEEFIAWLYNDSPVRNTVLINGNMASFDGCLHGDIKICMDYSNLWQVRRENWEYSFKLDKTSWKHRFDTTLSDYMSSEEVIANIVRTVSCNGNVLINIGPTKYGTISPIFEERLRDMGHWLKINGEAIYGSKPWIYQEDNSSPNVWYTSNREKDILYAIILNYPYDTNELELQPFGEFGMNSKTYSLTLLGMEDTPINWTVNNNTIHIQMPPKHLIDKRKLQFAWTFKISINKYDEAPCEYLEELNTSDDKAEEINMLYIN